MKSDKAEGPIALRPFDMHCPLMKTSGKPQGNNYWKELCEYRQEQPDLKRTCFPKCKVSSMPNLLDKSEEEKKDIGKRFLDKYERGMTFIDIAEEEDVSVSTVSKYIRMIINKSPRKSKFSIKDGEVWLALKYEKGISVIEISEIYGCSCSSVNKYIKLAQQARG